MALNSIVVLMCR